jgi:hypothetical protein
MDFRLQLQRVQGVSPVIAQPLYALGTEDRRKEFRFRRKYLLNSEVNFVSMDRLSSH